MSRSNGNRGIWRARLRGALCVLCVSVVFCAVGQAGERWALLIGVDKCKALGELKVCCADARAMKAMLERLGYQHIRMLTDDAPDPLTWPTIGNIEGSVEEIAGAAGQDDTILVFFSGHGLTERGGCYLVPVDGSRRRAIALSWVADQLSQSTTRQAVLILDACHAGAAKGVDGIAPDLARAANVAMLLSCGEGQVSWPDEERGHSVFTWYILEGLGGKAAGSDRAVTQKELFDYVEPLVRARTYEQQGRSLQTPLFARGLGGEIILAQCPPEDIDVASLIAGLMLPTGWASGPRRVHVATPGGDRLKEVTYYRNTIGMDLVLVSPGEFMMGGDQPAEEVARLCNYADANTQWFSDEQPQHSVRITRPFFMGGHEVTQTQ
jgi:hypothetical protein